MLNEYRNLKRNLAALKQVADSKKANQPAEENPYASWSTEELEAEMDRFMNKPRVPQPWDNMSLEELKYYYADMMRDKA